MTKKDKFVNRKHVRPGTGDKALVMDDIAQKGHCPFCPGHREESGVGNPIHTTEHWATVHNRWPYENSAINLVLMTNSHVEDVSEITEELWLDALQAVKWAQNHLEIKGGGLVLRFGDSDLTGATVHHLHFQIIVPELDDGGEAKVVYFPIG